MVIVNIIVEEKSLNYKFFPFIVVFKIFMIVQTIVIEFLVEVRMQCY